MNGVLAVHYNGRMIECTFGTCVSCPEGKQVASLEAIARIDHQSGRDCETGRAHIYIDTRKARGIKLKNDNKEECKTWRETNDETKQKMVKTF